MSLCLWGASLVAQPQYVSDSLILEQARQDIEILTGKEFAGRGYQAHGHRLAAQMIARRFAARGLQPLTPPYVSVSEEALFIQSFPISINLAEDALLVIGKDTLEDGKDFLIHPLSSRGKGTFDIWDAGHGLGSFEGARGKAVLIRDGWPDSLQHEAAKQARFEGRKQLMQRISFALRSQPAAILVLQDKLTHSFANQQAGVPLLTIQKAAWPPAATQVHLEVAIDITEIYTQNVLGYLEGHTHPDSFLVLTAHYDHLGQWGTALFPGANDNASGTAMLLSMADHFSRPENRPSCSVLFIAFGAEETGLAGSRFYVESEPLVPLSKMKFLLNLDLMGNGDKGIMAVGGKDFPSFYDQLVAANDTLQAVPAVRARPNAPNSDHYFFLENGVPGFFVFTMGGPPHYHDIHDTADALLLSRFVEVRKLLLHFLHAL